MTNKTFRWLLYHNRFKNDTKGFDENDLVICYRKVFNDPDCGEVFFNKNKYH